MTQAERDIIEHSLGLDYGKKAFRNRYCVGLNSPDYTLLCEMVGKGWMQAGNFINDKEDRYFHVTDAGAKAVAAELPSDD